MKLGIICHTGIGGSATVACELARQLGARGHEVHVIGRSHPQRLHPAPDNVRFHGVPRLNLPVSAESLPTLEFASAIATIAAREGLDLLHAHYSVPHAISAQLARDILRHRHPLPVVTTLHGTDVTSLGSDPHLHGIARLAITGSDAVTAVSRSLAETAASVLQVPPVPVIPNFIEPTPFRRPHERATNPSPDQTSSEPVLVHVSNFRPVKRATDCIRILDFVQRQRPCRLLLVGQGPDLAAARELTRALGLTACVDFVGEQQDVATCLHAAEVLLVPSETEAFGMAALEAMAAGVPVVGSRAGGLPEVVEDGVTGRLLPAGDLQGMADAVLDILGQPALAKAFGANGRQRAEEHFSPERIIPLYLALYSRTLDGFRNQPIPG